jgi:hypothetical protein
LPPEKVHKSVKKERILSMKKRERSFLAFRISMKPRGGDESFVSTKYCQTDTWD